MKIPMSFLVYLISIIRGFLTRAKLEGIKGKYQGRTVFCVGNGPSLRGQDLSALTDEVVVCTNRAFLIPQLVHAKERIHVFSDVGRISEVGDQLDDAFPDDVKLFTINKYDMQALSIMRKQSGWLFIPPISRLRRCRNMLGVVTSSNIGFSHDISKEIYTGYTVIFSAIQIARYLGASRIVMLGVDMTIGVKSAQTHVVDGVVNLMPEFDYERHAKPMFEYFREELSRSGVELLNATDGGMVDSIPRIRLEKI